MHSILFRFVVYVGIYIRGGVFLCIYLILSLILISSLRFTDFFNWKFICNMYVCTNIFIRVLYYIHFYLISYFII